MTAEPANPTSPLLAKTCPAVPICPARARVGAAFDRVEKKLIYFNRQIKK